MRTIYSISCYLRVHACVCIRRYILCLLKVLLYMYSTYVLYVLLVCILCVLYVLYVL